MNDVNSVLGLLHHVDIGDVASVSDVHAATIFMVKMCRLASFLVYEAFG
jgi:hypothetical protein